MESDYTGNEINWKHDKNMTEAKVCWMYNLAMAGATEICFPSVGPESYGELDEMIVQERNIEIW